MFPISIWNPHPSRYPLPIIQVDSTVGLEDVVLPSCCNARDDPEGGARGAYRAVLAMLRDLNGARDHDCMQGMTFNPLHYRSVSKDSAFLTNSKVLLVRGPGIKCYHSCKST